jgi:hypothetical protein
MFISDSWWWHFEIPKHVAVYWAPIHWMSDAFVGLLLISTSWWWAKKC